MPGSQPPGWYPAPGSPAVERWWDGTRWTGEVRDATAAPGGTDDFPARFGDSPTMMVIPPGAGPQPPGGPAAVPPPAEPATRRTLGNLLGKKKPAPQPPPEARLEATWRASAVEA